MDNTFGKSTENLTNESPANKSRNPLLTTASSRRSNSDENVRRLELNKSVLMSRKNQSFANKRSNESIDDNNDDNGSGDHGISSAKGVEHNTLEASQLKSTNNSSKRQRFSHPKCVDKKISIFLILSCFISLFTLYMTMYISI